MKYKNSKIESQCPVCNHKTANLLWSVSAKEVTSHFCDFKSLQGKDLYAHLKKNYADKFEVHQCHNCLFSYAFPFKAGDYIFYNLAYPTNSYPSWRWEYGLALNNISRKKIIKPKILEIGAGSGLFLKEILKRGISEKENISAIEYSNKGKAEIQKIGVDCSSLDVRDEGFFLPHASYDFICLFQVLEHMDDLENLIEKLLTLLNKDGEIHISVPNNKRIEFMEKNGSLLDMPPNHIGRWTKKAFEIFSDRPNLKLDNFQTEDSSFFTLIKQFFAYRLLKKTQKKSIHYYLYYKTGGLSQKLVINFLKIIDLFMHIGLVYKLYSNKRTIGGSHYVVLTKT
jgi:SAM-dependent methyltransferase